jgi:hypothetical protein
MVQGAGALDDGDSRLDRPGRTLALSARVPRLTRLLCHPGVVLSVCLGIAILTRVVGLDQTVTADEGFWMQRTLRFGAALERGDLESTFRSGHPGVTVMWTGLVGMGSDRAQALIPTRYLQFYVLEHAPSYRETFAAARLAIALLTAGLITAAIGLAWRLLGAGPALVGGWLLLFDPFTTGVTRLLHVDALLAPLMVVAVLAVLVAWRDGWQRRYVALSAVATGLALLTKPPAVVVGLMVAALAADTMWRSPPRRRSVVAALILWGGLVGLTYAICWPALWINPIGVLTAVASFALAQGASPHPGGVFFLGQSLSQDPGPLFYPLAFVLRLGLLPTIGLTCLLLLRRSDRRLVMVPALVGYVILFVAVMSVGAKKLDRYLLPALMVGTLLAGVGLCALAQWTGRAAPAVIAGCLGVQLWLFVASQPYPIAAYNPLLGGTAVAQRLIMVGWGEGLDQVTAYLNARRGADRLVVASNYPNAVRPRFLGATHALTRLPQVARIDYIVLYISTVQRGRASNWTQQVVAAGPPVFAAQVHGASYAWVFHVPAGLERPPPPTPGDQPQDDDEDGDEDR